MVRIRWKGTWQDHVLHGTNRTMATPSVVNPLQWAIEPSHTDSRDLLAVLSRAATCAHRIDRRESAQRRALGGRVFRRESGEERRTGHRRQRCMCALPLILMHAPPSACSRGAVSNFSKRSGCRVVKERP